MIKHIVLFKFKEDTDEKTDFSSIKESLENLTQFIPELKKIEVGLNSNPNEKYDLALTTEFDNWESLKIYAEHPEHLKVGAVIRKTLELRACVDYEL